MENRKIAWLASQAAMLMEREPEPDFDDGRPHELALYAYCRARNFPPPEQLARKSAEIMGRRFDPDQWRDNPHLRAGFDLFRAVALALDPVREEDRAPQTDETGHAADEDTMADIKATLAKTGQAAMDQAIVDSGGQLEDQDKDEQEKAKPEKAPDKSAKSGKTAKAAKASGKR